METRAQSQESQDESRELKTTLLVVDPQNDFLEERGFYSKGYKESGTRSGAGFTPLEEHKTEIQSVIDNIVLLIKAARLAPVPIAYITAEYSHAYAIMNPRLLNVPGATVPCRPSTWGACLVDPICDVVYDKSQPYNPADEIIIRKHTYDGFFKTELLEFLKKRDVEVVVVSGAETNACVMRTAETAALHQFRAVILDDCVWSHKPSLAQNALANFWEVYGWLRSAIKVKDSARSVSPDAFRYTLAGLKAEKWPHDGGHLL